MTFLKPLEETLQALELRCMCLCGLHPLASSINLPLKSQVLQIDSADLT